MNRKLQLSAAAIMVLMIALFASCAESDFEISQSVFIQDYDYPGLPIYSEWGYNTFGMYLDRGTFVSSNESFPVKIIVNPDTFNITFSGKYNGSPASLRIALMGYAPTDYIQLIELNDSIVNLKDDNCMVTLTHDGRTSVLKIIDGRLIFKRTQSLYIDKEFIKTILSGKIEFKTFMNNQPVAITNGRFDLGIGYENFYYY